jgi:hypothetical protein
MAGCSKGVGHAGERTRQGAAPLGRGPDQVNTLLRCSNDGQWRPSNHTFSISGMNRWHLVSALLIAFGTAESLAGPAAKGALPHPSAARPVRIVEIRPRHRFHYSYPASAAVIPALDRLLRKEAREELTDLREQARIPQSGISYPMTYDQEWSVTADTRNLLALSSIGAVFWGGAHGMEGYRTMIWGKIASRPLALGELFTRPHAGLARLTSEFCPKFTRARAARQRADAAAVAAPLPCPDAAKTAVVPLAGRGGRIVGFRMMLTGEDIPDGRPDGSYEIDIPLSPALRLLLSPRFAAPFRRQPQ